MILRCTLLILHTGWMHGLKHIIEQLYGLVEFVASLFIELLQQGSLMRSSWQSIELEHIIMTKEMCATKKITLLENFRHLPCLYA